MAGLEQPRAKEVDEWQRLGQRLVESHLVRDGVLGLEQDVDDIGQDRDRSRVHVGVLDRVDGRENVCRSQERSISIQERANE